MMIKGIDYTGITTVFFCHDGEGNYVLGKRSQNCRDEQGKWDVGGGSLEYGLTLEENLHKEIREEYCTDVLEHEFLGYGDILRELEDGTKTHWLAMFFKVLVDKQKVDNGEPESIDEIGWFSFGDLIELDNLHSQAPIYLKLYKDKLKM